VMIEEVETLLAKFYQSDYFIWSVIVGALFLLYRTLLGPNKPKEVECVKFNNNSTKFEAIRRRTFPGPYPNGWYNIGVSKMIKKGEIKTVSCLGEDLVIFRGNDNKLGVLNAHCPHIGAHLGVGGKVVGNAIECPFHGWRFNKEGECVHIPYTNKEIPCVARTKAWYFRDSPPRYEMVDIPEVENGGYYYGGVLQLTFNQHISEMFGMSIHYLLFFLQCNHQICKLIFIQDKIFKFSSVQLINNEK
jgi:nitrite reductase/ring-hydroxylating ferredoxin subunit